jgi:putative phosphoribosyl transferase
MSERFADRRDAGRQLARRLKAFRNNAVVLALPRGGVESAVEVARELNAPLDLIIAHKIGSRYCSEQAIGAVTETATIWADWKGVGSTRPWLRQTEKETRAEVGRRREAYLSGRARIPLADQVAIVVDDGIATGFTIRAAVAEVKEQHSRKIIVATPVISWSTFENLQSEDNIDSVVALVSSDASEFAVEDYYQDFSQLTDEDVVSLLAEAEPAPAPHFNSGLGRW